MSTEPEKQTPTPATMWHAVLMWAKSQSTETILLCAVLAALYQGLTLWIPQHIAAMLDGHAKAVKDVTDASKYVADKDERQREADRKNDNERFQAQQKLLEKFLERQGFANGNDPRNLAKRPE